MIDYYNSNKIKILVVGAGGIGCELLKNLVLSGFTQIEIIDLDTIELSNLNRQFLFQKIHVGYPKAEIASKNVIKLNPSANIIYHHDTVMSEKFNLEYFKKFNIVLNALDNKGARSHVNRMCLAADVPLIESGSAGYLGQVTVIKKGLTECYDCLPKPPAKTFPGCTIRNTPSEPVHCIVWAKNLFNQLFGSEDPDEAVSPDSEDPLNDSNTENKKPIINDKMSARKWAEESSYDSAKIFHKLFYEDIKYLLSMKKLWEKRIPPTPLDYSIIKSSETTDIKNITNNQKLVSQNIWSIHECLEKFCDSIGKLKLKIQNLSNGQKKALIWDKDDEDSLIFVTAASNLRSYIFSIPLKSKFDVKSIAGNIIPAIATTNAIIAGLIVLETVKIINEEFIKCKTVYLRDKPLQQKIIVDSCLIEPNDKCYVCKEKPEMIIKINVLKFTVKQLELQILKHELNMIAPDVEIDDGSGRIIISSEEDETIENINQPLSHFGLQNGSFLKCDDFLQNYQIKLIINNDFEIDDGYEILSYALLQNSKETVSIKKLTKKRNLQDYKDEKSDTNKKRKLSENSSINDISIKLNMEDECISIN